MPARLAVTVQKGRDFPPHMSEDDPAQRVVVRFRGGVGRTEYVTDDCPTFNAQFVGPYDGEPELGVEIWDSLERRTAVGTLPLDNIAGQQLVQRTVDCISEVGTIAGRVEMSVAYGEVEGADEFNVVQE